MGPHVYPITVVMHFEGLLLHVPIGTLFQVSQPTSVSKMHQIVAHFYCALIRVNKVLVLPSACLVGQLRLNPDVGNRLRFFTKRIIYDI
uniref:Uncharacterized protein n=1 Tax=Strigamia maritima TaxID=126957 RepID=T1JIM3_STRMM